MICAIVTYHSEASPERVCVSRAGLKGSDDSFDY